MASLDDFEDRHVVVIGLGYVGLTLGAYLADLGFQVHGVEIRSTVLKSLDNKKAFFWEPKLDDILRRNIDKGNFTYSTKVERLDKRRVFIITVGTPINEDKSPILESISTVSKQVASVMKDGDMVILRSTVRLNTTENLVKPILSSSKKIFDLAFCPERTLEGAALSELGSLPQIIGADNERSRLRASKFFQKVTPNIVNVSNLATAEMIKLVDNMQRDVFFAVSNEVAHLCNRQDINAFEVVSAGKLGYSRTNLAVPGPVGGPCLEKDSYILAESVAESGGIARIAMAARKTNENVINEATEFISFWIKENVKTKVKKIAILGMAFKGVPETNDLRGSPSVDLVQRLRQLIENVEIYCWDPVIPYSELKQMGFNSTETPEELFEDVCAVVLVNNHPHLDELNLIRFLEKPTNSVLVYDFWGRNHHKLLEVKNYHWWGNHSKYIRELEIER